MTDLAQAMVEHFEQCRLTAYKDSRGFWTIGWGHLLGADHDWTGYAISQEAADAWLKSDLSFAKQQATNFPRFAEMNDIRQAVCVSMCFQLGSSPLYWPKFTAALEVCDWAGAETAGLDSLWAKETPGRAELEMSMLQSGNWEIPA
jgi:lysozyme